MAPLRLGVENAKIAGTVACTGPTPATTSEVPERDPPNPRNRGETVESFVFDDPCPGSFGTEQPEPAVHMAIYHYASRVGHFQIPASGNRGPLPEHTRRVGSIPIPEISLPADKRTIYSGN